MEMPDISRARNTGAEVKKHSLQNLKNLYEPIKKELGPTECERVGFCENDVDPVPGKTYQVIDLIRLMSLFNNELYPWTENKHPVQVYTSAGRIVERWETDWDCFQRLVPKLRQLMDLHDRAYLLLSDWTSRQRGPDRNGFDNNPLTLPFTGKRSEHKVSTAFVYPLLSGLRLLLDDNCNWKADPQQFLREAGPSLIAVLMTFYDEHCKSKPHECGRAVGSWRAVAAEARARFAEASLARMQAAATA